MSTLALLPCPKRYPGRLQNTIERRSEFYDFVENVNQELMKAEPSALFIINMHP